MAKIKIIDDREKTTTDIEVKLSDAPFDHHGKPASILAAAEAHDIFIEHACGGVCACSTCHVIVEQGAEHLSEGSEQEEDMLDLVPGLTMHSRLSCQAEITDDNAEIVVRIPVFNRNAVSESAGPTA